MNPRTRNILILVAAVIVSFGIGAAWQFSHVNRTRAELATTSADLDTVRYDLALERLQSTLALATVAAQLGNYERARQLTSEFFSGLQANAPAAPDAARTEFESILGGRDGTITSLSRAEPGAGLELARMLGRFRDALGLESGGLAPAGAMTAPMSTAAGDTMG